MDTRTRPKLESLDGKDALYGAERRSPPRRLIVVDAGFEAFGAEEPCFDCQTMDLSLDEVSVTSTRPLREGQRGLIVICGPELPIVGVAAVVETPALLETVSVARLEFVTMSSPNKSRLSQLLGR